MSILYIITLSSWGGAQRYVHDLAVNLDGHGFEVGVAAGGSGPLFEKLQAASIATHPLRFLKRIPDPLSAVWGILEIRALLKRGHYDIVHLSSTSAGVLGTIAARFVRPRPKVIYTLHGAAFWNQPGPAWLRFLFFLAEKFTAPLKDFFISVTDYERNLWTGKDLAPSTKIVTIHNGVAPDEMRFLEPAEARQKIFEIAKFSRSPRFLIGAISNLFPQKGIEDLIAAAGALRAKDIGFVVFGEGMRRASLEELRRKHGLDGRVAMPGRVDDAWQYLKGLDAFVLPSRQEALPYSVLEAMTAGIPIVATKVGGVPELIREREEGLLVDPQNPAKIAEAIAYFLEHPEEAKRFGEQARKRVAEEFSLARMLEAHKKIYERSVA